MPFEFRYGNPRTEEERAERHSRLYPGTELPPRGTGRRRMVSEGTDTELVTGLLFGSLASLLIIAVLLGIERSKK